MPRIRTNEKGNMALLFVSMAGVLVLIGLLVVNVNMLISTHKRVQNAIDAAALEAAKQMTSITVSSPMGEIGIADLSYADPSNPLKKANPNNQQPVIGFNTALATVRLDMLIAEDLNDAQMKALAAEDVSRLKDIGQQLGTKIDKATASGGSIWKAVQAMYTSNFDPHSDQTVDRKAVVFKINPGRLKVGSGLTNTNIPTQADPAATTNSQSGKYKPYVNIPAGDKNFAFIHLSDQPALVDGKEFIAWQDSDYDVSGFGIVPPSVVRVQVYNKITASVGAQQQNSEEEKKKESVTQAAYASAGTSSQSFRSTAYCIGFQGGLPDTTQFPKMTIKDILGFSGWTQPKQDATWLKAEQGDFPGRPLKPSEFRPGRGLIQSPSTALSYGLYDWLRSLGTKVNRQSAVQALSTTDLRALALANGSKGAWNKFACVSQDPENSPTNMIYEALRDNTELGEEFYKDTVNYNSAEEAISMGGDPITGMAVPPRGNNSIEMCQLIEGLLATNRAGTTAACAGVMAMIEADDAANWIDTDGASVGGNNSGDVIHDLMKAIMLETNDVNLATKLSDLQKAIRQYLSMQAVMESPPDPEVRAEFDRFLSESISSNTAIATKNKYRKTLLDDKEPGNYLFVQLLPYNRELALAFARPGSYRGGIEFLRMRAAQNRAYRVIRNGQSVSQRSTGAMTGLKRYGAVDGIRRVDGHDMYPTSPVFVWDIMGQVPVVTAIMPNNEPTITRNGPSARPRFFNYDQPTFSQVRAFHREILQVKFKPGDAVPTSSNNLLCGSKRLPMDEKIPSDKRYCWDAAGWPFVIAWPGETTAAQYHYGSFIGWWAGRLPYHPIYLKGGMTQTNIKLVAADDAIMNPPSVNALRADVQSYKKKKGGSALLGASPTELESDVFILSANSSGDIKVNYIKNPNKEEPKFPFSGHLVRKNQYLYFSGAATRTPAPIITSGPSKVYRDVMSRDQFADVTKGEGHYIQEPSTWCHQGFGLLLNIGFHECPLMAGEWTMGNPYSVGCCSVPKVETEFRETVHGAPYFIQGVSFPADPPNKAICPKWIHLNPFDGVKYHSIFLPKGSSDNPTNSTEVGDPGDAASVGHVLPPG